MGSHLLTSPKTKGEDKIRRDPPNITLPKEDNMKRCIAILVATLLIPFTLAYAGNGKIAGTVKDAAGKAIPGANVLVEGTKLGGSADVNGNYYVLNVTPGTYNVAVSAVGYGRRVYRGVVVISDRTTDLDIEMTESAVELEAVVVEAERKLVEKTQTSTRTVVTAEDIRALPVLNVYELAQNTANNYEGFVRGGARYETKTIVDGVDLTDIFYAPAADGISPSAAYVNVIRQNERHNTLADVSVGSVNELAVNTGAVDADYRSATAGVVSINLREGRGALSGKIDVKDRTAKSIFAKQKHYGADIYWDADKYFTERNTLLTKVPASRADTLKARRYTWTPGKYNYGDRPERDVEASVGGNITNDWNFFASGHYFNSYGLFPNEFNRQVTMQLKSGIQLSDQIKLTAFGIVEDRGKLFGWKNRVYNDIMRFFLEGVPVYDGLTWLGSAKWSHFLASDTYYEIQLSHTYRNDRRGFVDGNGDGIIEIGENGDFIEFADSATVAKYASDFNVDRDRAKFFSTGYTDPDAQVTFGNKPGGGAWKLARPVPFYENTRTIDNSFRFDFTSQVTVNHQLRLGTELTLHNVRLSRISGAEVGSILDNKEPIRREGYNYDPFEIGFYAQDRMEYAGLIVNVGVRVDAFNRDINKFLNWFDALHRETTTNPGGTASVSRTVATLGEKLKTEWYFSPRIGVSHPISDNAAMYFSFARMTQQPPLSRLYANHDGLNQSTATFTTFPDVEQKPIRSTNYELGVQWSFAPRWGVDVNAYYRDIENYSTIGGGITSTSRVASSVSPASAITMNWQTSWGYADARGLEITFKKLPSKLFDFVSLSGRASYTFAFIKGAVNAGANRQDFTASRDSAKFGGDLPREDIQRYNSYEANLLGGGSTLDRGFDRAHRGTIAAILDFPVELRWSVNGLIASGFKYSERFLGDPRARSLATAPPRIRFDMRFEKSFTFGERSRIGIYMDVRNVFNNVNILAYDASIDGQLVWEQTMRDWRDNNGPRPTPTGPATAQRVITNDGSYVYEIARQVYFGITIEY